MSKVSPSRPEFYVGYAPVTPRGLALFRRRAVAAFTVAALLIAVLIVLAQQSFVPSVFEFLDYRTFQGVVEELPYPALLVRRPGVAGGDRAFSRYLLAIPGKRGAASVAAGLQGKQVRLEGSVIHLDGHTVVEIKEGTLEVTSTAPPADALGRTNLGKVTVEGEIVDSKCYLGVMNPGKGKVHKACATRCISGGIPPGLLVRDEAGGESVLILAGSDGRPLHKELLGMIGEPVRVTGNLMRSGDSLFFYAEPDQFHRLGG